MAMSTRTRTNNLLGAFGLAVGDRIRGVTEHAGGHGAAAPAALTALHQFLSGGSIEDLRDVVGLSHSGTVRLVDRLEADGLVERRHGADGRAVSLRLTRAGRRRSQRIQAARAQALEAIVDTLSDVERSQLESVLERLLATLTEQRVEARLAGAPPTGGWLCRLCDLGACGRDEGRCPTAAAARAAVPAGD